MKGLSVSFRPRSPITRLAHMGVNWWICAIGARAYRFNIPIHIYPPKRHHVLFLGISFRPHDFLFDQVELSVPMFFRPLFFLGFPFWVFMLNTSIYILMMFVMMVLNISHIISTSSSGSRRRLGLGFRAQGQAAKSLRDFLWEQLVCDRVTESKPRCKGFKLVWGGVHRWKRINKFVQGRFCERYVK